MVNPLTTSNMGSPSQDVNLTHKVQEAKRRGQVACFLKGMPCKPQEIYRQMPEVF